MSEMIRDLPFRSRAEIDAVQERNFAEMLDLCFERHPYFRRVFRERGLSRRDISGLVDIHKLPIIAKQDYMVEPENFRLETSELPEEMRVTWDVMHTTGTSSGTPTPFYSTTYDFYNILTTNRRALEIRGVLPTDIVANLCPLTVHPYGAYHRTIAAANAMKIPVVSPLPGKPSEYFHWSAGIDEVVDTILRSRTTILWGVASYVRRVVMHAETRGEDLSFVRLVFVTGEAVTEEFRADIVRRLGAMGAADPKVSVSYAATEMQVGTVECRPGSGYHNPAPDEFFFEIVDPETHEPLPDGERGMAVMTHLNRRGTVLLRYALGDLTVLSHEQCPHCGAWTDRFVEMPSRADDLVKVKGMLINPSVLTETLVAMPAVAEYQIVIDRSDPDDKLSMDKLTVRIAPARGGEGLEVGVAEAVKAAIGVTPDVEMVPINAIYDPDKSLKSKRLIDLRK
ncbi:MAG: AMP-binding protein [Rhodospirillaceae bacterium]|jgi:phenylacetate-CoA ligase|nr:AMP-binding protein [Rhodospirillaceae bacterium]MBT6138011.1 AMP-binding protein [Rhodospirillaceae bacterium]